MMAYPSTTVRGTRIALILAIAAATLFSLLVVATPAQAAPGVPVTYEGQTVPVNRPTENKPQSKLWYADGAWWALMVSPSDSLVHVHELMANHSWRDTGTVVDRRVNSTGDALWVPQQSRLTVVSRTGQGLQVARFGYNSTQRSWSLNSGYPITLQTGGGSESATIDQDSTGRLWVTYTRSGKLWVAVSDPNGLNWSAGFNPAVGDFAISSDDISALIAFGSSIGLLWSDQASGAFRFAIHKDGDPVNVWRVEAALAGAKLVDDHINLKQVSGDAQGRIFAAIKTSKGDVASDPPTDTLVGVLIRTPRADGTGLWSLVPAGTVADDHTRPIIMIDQTNQELYFFATAPVTGGDIYYKKTSLNNPSFPPGRGTRFLDSVKQMNNATGSKDPVTAQTGLVILASGLDRYAHAEMALAGGPPPPPPPPPGDTTAPTRPTGLTATPSADRITLTWTASTDNVGVAGYTVRRGDGLVVDAPSNSYPDTAVNPGATYTYTVEAFDAAGNRSMASSPATATVPGQPPPGNGPIALRAVTSATNNTEATLTVPVPETEAGDLLLASIDVRGQPTITAPVGWQLVREDLNGTAMRKGTYWRIATGSEPASYTWRFSAKPPAVGIMLAYSGVSTTAPIEASSGRLSTGATVSAPSVQTSVAGAQLVGLFGVARVSAITAPNGMQERAEVGSPTGTQYPVTAESADAAAPAPGPTGDRNATSSVQAPGIGHLVALRPAN